MCDRHVILWILSSTSYQILVIRNLICWYNVPTRLAHYIRRWQYGIQIWPKLILCVVSWHVNLILWSFRGHKMRLYKNNKNSRIWFYVLLWHIISNLDLARSLNGHLGKVWTEKRSTKGSLNGKKGKKRHKKSDSMCLKTKKHGTLYQTSILKSWYYVSADISCHRSVFEGVFLLKLPCPVSPDMPQCPPPSSSSSMLPREHVGGGWHSCGAREGAPGGYGGVASA